MMRGLSLLTTMVLAGHMLLGCCLHHVHSAEHTAAVQPEHEPEAPLPPLCDHGRCYFVSLHKAPHGAGPAASTPAAIFPTAVAPLNRCSVEPMAGEIDVDGPPLRSHLIYCRLLI